MRRRRVPPAATTMRRNLIAPWISSASNGAIWARRHGGTRRGLKFGASDALVPRLRPRSIYPEKQTSDALLPHGRMCAKRLLDRKVGEFCAFQILSTIRPYPKQPQAGAGACALSISSKVRPLGSNPNAQNPITPRIYHAAK